MRKKKNKSRVTVKPMMDVNYYRDEEGAIDVVGFHVGEDGKCLLMRSDNYTDQDRQQGMNILCICTDDAAEYEELEKWRVDGNELKIELGPKAQSLGLPKLVTGKLPDDVTERAKILEFLEREIVTSKNEDK